MQRPPQTLDSDRLRLRKPVAEDAEAIFQKYARDPETTQYLIWRPHQAIGETREFIARCMRCWKEGSSFPWCVEQKSDNELVGMLELHPDTWSAELGYVIAPEYRRRGYATEITKAVIGWGLAQAEIYRVWATCDTENVASAAVLEKAGMLKEGRLRRYMLHPNISQEPRDSYIYAAVK